MWSCKNDVNQVNQCDLILARCSNIVGRVCQCKPGVNYGPLRSCARCSVNSGRQNDQEAGKYFIFIDKIEEPLMKFKTLLSFTISYHGYPKQQADVEVVREWRTCRHHWRGSGWWRWSGSAWPSSSSPRRPPRASASASTPISSISWTSKARAIARQWKRGTDKSPLKIGCSHLWFQAILLWRIKRHHPKIHHTEKTFQDYQRQKMPWPEASPRGGRRSWRGRPWSPRCAPGRSFTSTKINCAHKKVMSAIIHHLNKKITAQILPCRISKLLRLNFSLAVGRGRFP